MTSILFQEFRLTLTLKQQQMRKLIYKRGFQIYGDTEHGAWTEGNKVWGYDVFDNDTDMHLGFIEKNVDLGWMFYRSQYEEWYGGWDTLKEIKEWLGSERPDGVQIIDVILQECDDNLK